VSGASARRGAGSASPDCRLGVDLADPTPYTSALPLVSVSATFRSLVAATTRRGFEVSPIVLGLHAATFQCQHAMLADEGDTLAE
jgi:hypothetical protein